MSSARKHARRRMWARQSSSTTFWLGTFARTLRSTSERHFFAGHACREDDPDRLNSPFESVHVAIAAPSATAPSKCRCARIEPIVAEERLGNLYAEGFQESSTGFATIEPTLVWQPTRKSSPYCGGIHLVEASRHA